MGMAVIGKDLIEGVAWIRAIFRFLLKDTSCEKVICLSC